MDELIRGLKARDQGAFERLLREHGDRLFRFARRMVGPAEAEDVVQEVFLRVHRSIDSFDPSGSFPAWLFTIAHNLCRDRGRRAAPEHAELGEIPGPAGRAGVENREIREALARAVAELPPDQKQVFLMREEAGLSFREIAQAIGCPLNTALGRMHYAMEKLRRSLKAFRE